MIQELDEKLNDINRIDFYNGESTNNFNVENFLDKEMIKINNKVDIQRRFINIMFYINEILGRDYLMCNYYYVSEYIKDLINIYLNSDVFKLVSIIYNPLNTYFKKGCNNYVSFQIKCIKKVNNNVYIYNECPANNIDGKVYSEDLCIIINFKINDVLKHCLVSFVTEKRHNTSKTIFKYLKDDIYEAYMQKLEDLKNKDDFYKEQDIDFSYLKALQL